MGGGGGGGGRRSVCVTPRFFQLASPNEVSTLELLFIRTVHSLSLLAWHVNLAAIDSCAVSNSESR